MPSRKKPPDVSQEDWDDADIPEWTEEAFARARPFKEVFRKQYESWKRDQAKKLGPPPGRCAEDPHRLPAGGRRGERHSRNRQGLQRPGRTSAARSLAERPIVSTRRARSAAS